MTSRSKVFAFPVVLGHAGLLVAAATFLVERKFPANGIGPDLPESQAYSPFALLLDLLVFFGWYVLPGMIVCAVLGFAAAALLGRSVPETVEGWGETVFWCTVLPFLVFFVGALLIPTGGIWTILQGTGFGFGIAASSILGYFGARAARRPV